jgi:hypothetical protein
MSMHISKISGERKKISAVKNLKNPNAKQKG